MALEREGLPRDSEFEETEPLEHARTEQFRTTFIGRLFNFIQFADDTPKINAFRNETVYRYLRLASRAPSMRELQDYADSFSRNLKALGRG